MASTVLGLVALVFLVAPGLLFQILQERKRPQQTETVFRETSRVLLSGVIFSTASIMLLSVARAVRPESLPDPGAWLQDPAAYVQAEYRTIALFLLAQLLISLGVATFAHHLIVRSSVSNIKPVTAWHAVFRERCPQGATPAVRVKLDDDSVFVGKLHSYSTTDGPTPERELVLGPPLWVRRAGQASLKKLPTQWQRVVVPGGSVRTIAVAYWVDGAEQQISTPRGSRFFRKWL